MSHAPEKYNHLKIFLHRENTTIKPEFGRKFLYVAENSFGLVKVKDISVDDNLINLVLEDAFSGQTGSFTIDINNKSLKFLMIAWEDVLDIVAQDRISTGNSTDLLEFDF
jgi:hypothetical protein